MPAQRKSNLAQQVLQTIKRYCMLERKDSLVVSVSGGPDSVALLYILNLLKKQMRLNLHIAHLDHMLRKESHKDLLFVKSLAEKLNLPITTERIAVDKLSTKGSLEEIARKARFDFLFKVANKLGVKKIALGHTKDDQAETVLMRIIRGAGLFGLSGILAVRKINGYTIIRPLIEVGRQDIERFLKQKKIKPCLDASNLEDIFFRNRVRHKLIPFLEKEYNRNIKEVLVNMAENAGTDYEYLQQVSEAALEKLLESAGKKPQPKNKYNLNLNKLLKIHPAIQRMVLRLVIADLKGDTRRLTYQHWREIENLLKTRPFGAIVDLPSLIAVSKQKKYLSIYLKTRILANQTRIVANIIREN